DVPGVSPGSPAPPRARHAVLDGQDLAVHVRGERPRGTLPDAAGRHPRLPGGLHGRTARLQRGRLEAETGPRPFAQRRTPRSRHPSEPEAVRRGPEEDASPRVRSTVMTADPDRLAGALICAGAVVGLVGSVATMSVFLGVPSFALVLLLGAYAFRKRKEVGCSRPPWFGSPPWVPSGASLPSSSFASTASSQRDTTGWPQFRSSGRRSPSRARWSSSSSPGEPDAGRVRQPFRSTIVRTSASFSG